MKRKDTAIQKLTTVDLQILLSLASKPMHGYGIKLDIAERTRGEMRLGSGTLYEAIQRLEQRALIGGAPPPNGERADPRRRYYQLQPAGEQLARKELERLATVVKFGQALDLLPRQGQV